MKFGLYHVDLQTQERKLRDGAKYLQSVIEKHRKKYEKKNL
jgi:beta-glucosidase/6-phospho-beta-glucosidase/beta-galactosidase